MKANRLRGSLFPVVLAALGLAGCAGDTATGPSNSRMFGLISGPIPPAQPFVVQARPRVEEEYPAVGVTPTPRSDEILTEPDRAKLEASLKRYSGTPSKPPIKRKKPVPPQG
jgi:hypothetical protein